MEFLTPAFGEVSMHRKKRKDYAFQHQFKEKPSIMPRREHAHIAQPKWHSTLVIVTHTLLNACSSYVLDASSTVVHSTDDVHCAGKLIILDLQVLLDLSCGSGLFTRRFVASNNFTGVIGADYSESMLQQTKQLFNQDQLLDSRYVVTSPLKTCFAAKLLHMTCIWMVDA